MRARNLKPGFFKNEDLAECDPLARILFAGLWCMADREGRMEYRPKRIKAELLPYDKCKIELLLMQLSKKGFIVIYEVNGIKYLSIPKFTEHQNCHVKEVGSTIPAPGLHITNTVAAGPLTESLLPITEPPLLNPGRGSANKSRSSPPQTKYLDSVFLSEYEYQQLEEVLGQKNLEVGIEKLDYSITVKGGKYKDHYKTLLNWFKRGWLKNEEGNGNGKGNGSRNSARSTGQALAHAGRAQSDGAPWPAPRVYGPE